MELPTLTKLYYAIGEVADIFQVAPSMIRYWEGEFTQLSPGKNSKGERKYTTKDIEKIKSIFHLVKEKGFTIEGAKKELENQKQETKERLELLKKLKDIQKRMVSLKNELDN